MVGTVGYLPMLNLQSIRDVSWRDRPPKTGACFKSRFFCFWPRTNMCPSPVGRLENLGPFVIMNSRGFYEVACHLPCEIALPILWKGRRTVVLISFSTCGRCRSIGLLQDCRFLVRATAKHGKLNSVVVNCPNRLGAVSHRDELGAV